MDIQKYIELRKAVENLRVWEMGQTVSEETLNEYFRKLNEKVHGLYRILDGMDAVMRLKILRVQNGDLRCKDDQGFECWLDPYVGCALYHSDYPLESLVGKTVEIPKDCITLQPIYAPQEGELKIVED